MDYRYETKDGIRDFHKKRIAFIIIDKKIEFLKNTEMSHWEYCEKKGISKEQFNSLIRGYYLDGSIVFYKDNFTYDDSVINIGLHYIDLIMIKCNIKIAKVYFGLKVSNSLSIWPYDYYYGTLELKDLTNCNKKEVENNK